MKLTELKSKLSELLYLEDTDVVDVVLAAELASRLGLGDPVWLVVIGPSSGGKSQIIRPVAVADPKFVHRVDDLTENTFISGVNTEETSLLLRIGKKGIILISDLTSLFSKQSEARDAILGQLRLVYDGSFTKYFGNRKPVSWEGSLGVIAASTPSIYKSFEYVADMGERFIYYRLKPLDPRKASAKAFGNVLYGKALDEAISELYKEYSKSVVIYATAAFLDINNVSIDPAAEERITEIALFAARMRTPISLDRETGAVDRIPVPEMPMRIVLQFKALARAMMLMEFHEEYADGVTRVPESRKELSERSLRAIEWCAYSLANEERRAVLRVLCHKDGRMSTQDVGSAIGLETGIAGKYLSHLMAVGLCERYGRGDGDERSKGGGLQWEVVDSGVREIVRRVDPIVGEPEVPDVLGEL